MRHLYHHAKGSRMAATVLDIFGQLDPPLWLVTAQAEKRRGGLIATFVNQASIPAQFPRVVVGLARQHFTWELIEKSRSFCLHLLAEENLEHVWRFGLQTGRAVDKFAGLSPLPTPSGNPRLPDCPAWLDCRVEAALATGDRTIYLAEVIDCGLEMKIDFPLTLKRLLQLTPPDK